MVTEINQKNEFVIALREYLKSKYNTNYHYTCGEDDFESKKIDDAYCLFRRDSDNEKNISGFFFRKDLCSPIPKNASEILKNIYEFSQNKKNIESELRGDGKGMKVKIGDRKYLVNSYIDEGHAGEISVSFMELPGFLNG